MNTDRPRVLIVEDSPTEAEELRAVLESDGFEVEHAATGEDGWRLFDASRFDLVATDIIMPETWGHELCRRIRADPRGATVPVVLLTSLDDPSGVIHGLECGADSYVVKPYDYDDIVGRFRNLMEAAKAAGTGERSEEIDFLGQRFTITADRGQILRYLLWSFEDMVRARRREEEARNVLQATLDGLTEQVAVLDESGVILAVNAAWRRAAATDCALGGGYQPGVNYLEACESAADRGDRDAAAAAAGIRDLIARRHADFKVFYRCGEGDGARWFTMRVARVDQWGAERIVVSRDEVGEHEISPGRS